MEKEILVEVQNVSKKFTIDLKKSLKYGAIDIMRSTFGFKTNKELRNGEFWAVKDISFKLRRGECIGLIGHNGAGKSTLLKVLNGLYSPDKGQVVMRGKIGALIELGAGFNPILSGRENIYNNAAILGFTKEEVNQKIQSIIDFSEIEKFIDMPVQNYSSGMKVRLGFAVAAHLEPDVLIIDEVLAVGDLGFILKCFKKIDELLPNTAVIFVSHSMPMVSRICNEIILMDRGVAEYQGNDIGKGVQLYYNKFSTSGENEVFNTGQFKLLSKICDIDNNVIKLNTNFTIELTFSIQKYVGRTPQLYVEFKDKEQRPIAGVYIKSESIIDINNKIVVYKATILDPLFTLGKYTVDIGLYDIDTESPIYRLNGAYEFVAEGTREMWIPFELKTNQYITLK